MHPFYIICLIREQETRKLYPEYLICITAVLYNKTLPWYDMKKKIIIQQAPCARRINQVSTNIFPQKQCAALNSSTKYWQMHFQETISATS